MGPFILCFLSFVAFAHSCELHSEEFQYTFSFTFNVDSKSFDQEQVKNGICAISHVDCSSVIFADSSVSGSEKTTYQFTVDGHFGHDLVDVLGGENGLEIFVKNVGYDCDSWFNQKSTATKKVEARVVSESKQPLPTKDDEGYANLASIPSNFDVKSRYIPSDIPQTSYPDTVGAFRFLCSAGHLAYDDPIVYPGQPGRSHLHQFFGNTLTNAFSTYSSLRTSGNSTCVNDLNRSAYWIPAMLDGKGNVIKPDYVVIYYKRYPNNDTATCFRQARKGCIPIPRGLRYIFGYDFVSNRTTSGGGYFNCDGAGAISGHFPTIAEAAKGCPPGARIGYVIGAPVCWDGKNLDTPNHRDHTADISYGWWGYPKCPDTHPFVIPAFTLGAWYTVPEDRADNWYLSSDVLPSGERLEGGKTLHADWFGAWDDEALNGFENGCINGYLSCNSGVLGDGRQMNDYWKHPDDQVRVVPVPERPVF